MDEPASNVVASDNKEKPLSPPPKKPAPSPRGSQHPPPPSRCSKTSAGSHPWGISQKCAGDLAVEAAEAV